MGIAYKLIAFRLLAASAGCRLFSVIVIERVILVHYFADENGRTAAGGTTTTTKVSPTIQHKYKSTVFIHSFIPFSFCGQRSLLGR